MEKKMSSSDTWAYCTLAMVAFVCVTVLSILSTASQHPFVVRVEMDNNTLEAIQTAEKLQEARLERLERCDTTNVTVYNYKGESIGLREAEMCLGEKVYAEVDSTQ